MIVGVYKWPGKSSSKLPNMFYLQALDGQGLPKHDSWWPKPSVWFKSGLHFGAWAPLSENWYQKRKNALSRGTEVAIQGKNWKGEIKFQRSQNRRFLNLIGGAAKEFVRAHRL
jgi:hypothetical protein